QVNSAVTQMDEMTQQNAALVEESAAAAHALEDQSRELNRLMGFFHVGEQSAQPVPVQAKPAAKPAPKLAVKATARPAAKAPARTHLAKLHDTPAPTAAAQASKDQDWAEF
ncbi:MAG: methyl-accepting chemotaxis protein, partial [Rhodospirillaceae bacterium]|nr:methyl-accepting chemotaxis protein [Rhodospirillales bacterium]